MSNMARLRINTGSVASTLYQQPELVRASLVIFNIAVNQGKT